MSRVLAAQNPTTPPPTHLAVPFGRTTRHTRLVDIGHRRFVPTSTRSSTVRSSLGCPRCQPRDQSVENSAARRSARRCASGPLAASLETVWVAASSSAASHAARNESVRSLRAISRRVANQSKSSGSASTLRNDLHQSLFGGDVGHPFGVPWARARNSASLVPCSGGRSLRATGPVATRSGRPSRRHIRTPQSSAAPSRISRRRAASRSSDLGQ